MGSYRTYPNPDKTAALIPEFVVEDLPSAELQPRFLRLQWRTYTWAQHSDDDDDDDDSIKYKHSNFIMKMIYFIIIFWPKPVAALHIT